MTDLNGRVSIDYDRILEAREIQKLHKIQMKQIDSTMSKAKGESTANEVTLQLTSSQCAIVRKVLMDYVRRINNLSKDPNFKNYGAKELNDVYTILKQI